MVRFKSLALLEDGVLLVGARNGAIVKCLNVAGRCAATGSSPEYVQMPRRTVVEPNFPEPFGLNTTLPIYVDGAQAVEVVITDLLGRVLSTERYDIPHAGRHELNLTPNLRSGTYVCAVLTRAGAFTERMVVVR